MITWPKEYTILNQVPEGKDGISDSNSDNDSDQNGQDDQDWTHHSDNLCASDDSSDDERVKRKRKSSSNSSKVIALWKSLKPSSSDFELLMVILTTENHDIFPNLINAELVCNQ